MPTPTSLTTQVLDFLTSAQFVLLLSAALFLWYVIATIVAYRKLSHIPGPPIAAISNLWWVKAAVSERGHLILSDVCKQYGPIVRIMPNTVVSDDMDLYRKVNIGARGSQYRKAAWYQAFKLDFGRDNLFTLLDHEKHAKVKLRLAPGYSGKDNPATEPTIDQVIMDLVRLITRDFITSKNDIKPLDFATLSQYFTLDVITCLVLGEPFGFVSDFSDKYGFVASMEASWPLINLISAAPILSRITRIPMLQKHLLPKVTDQQGLGKVKAVAQEVIARRFADEKFERHDMVLSFKKHGFSQEEIADECLMQLLAGSDTTATILRTGLYEIISNPQVYQSLTAEIFASCEKYHLEPNQVVPYSVATKLPYLQACIKEALRQNPAGTGLLPRVVGPQGDTHKGIYLPPGTEVGVCSWNIHRKNTEVYGPDADMFRPERWLEATGEQLAKMEEAVHLAFGYGAYRCIGENIAKIELNKVWFEILRRFDWRMINAQQRFTKDANYGLFVQRGMWVRVGERDAV